jgi:hypothetical protein
MTTYRVRLTDDWLPLLALLRALGWREGDQIGIDVIDDTLVVTRLSMGPQAPIRTAPTPRPRELRRR